MPKIALDLKPVASDLGFLQVALRRDLIGSMRYRPEDFDQLLRNRNHQQDADEMHALDGLQFNLTYLRLVL